MATWALSFRARCKPWFDGPLVAWFSQVASMDLKDLMQELLGELGKVSKADAVVGAVRDAGKAKILPLSKVSIGFGTAVGGIGGKARRGEGESDADASVGGAGGAIVVEPRAFVVVGEDGVPHMLALQNGKTAVVRRGVRILPQRTAEELPPAGQPPALGGKKE
jgi:uncharacterized spore protein YtfJ